MRHRWIAGLAGVAAVLTASAALATESLCRFAGSTTAIQVTNLSSASAPGELAVAPVGRVVLAPDGRRLYASTGAELAVVDVATMAPLDTIATPFPPSRYTVGPDGTLFAIQGSHGSPTVLPIDPHTGGLGAPIELPGVDDVLDFGIADGGRLLFVLGRGRDWNQIVRIVDLTGATADITTAVPVPAHQSIGMHVSPTGAFAYVPSARLPGSAGGTWLVPWAGEPVFLGFAEDGSRALFSPDGRRAYVMQDGLPEGGRPTLLVDTATHAVIGELPGGAVVAFADDDCVLLGAGRTLRRACPGDPHTPAVDPATLSPSTVTPVRDNGPIATTWTTGACAPPPLPCQADAPCLDLAGARGAPGDSIELAARLRTGARPVAGLQVDVFLDPTLPLPLAGSERPWLAACRVNPEIGKEPSTFACMESNEHGCLTFRSLVLSLLDVEPITDGATVFTCTLPIPADAAPGRYPMRCAQGGASDPDGRPLPVRCTDGAVIVEAGGEGTRPLAGAAATGACRVGPVGDPRALLLLVPPALWVAGRRSRTHRRRARGPRRARWLAVMAVGVASMALPAPAGAESLCRFTGRGHDTVEVTDLTAAAPPSHVLLPAPAGRVALSPGGDRLYVPTGRRLTVVDVATLQRLEAITMSNPPLRYTVGPDGALYVVQPHGAGWAVRVLDADGAYRKSLLLPGLVDVHGLGVGDGGRLLFVIGGDGSWYQTVRIIDLGEATTAIDVVVPMPWFLGTGMQVSPTDALAYVANARSPGLSDGGTWAVRPDREPLPLGIADQGGDAVFSPDGRLAYLVQSTIPGDGRPTLLVDTASDAVIAELPAGAIVGFAPDDCVLVAAGRTPLLACPGDDQARPIDLSTLDSGSITGNRLDHLAPTTWSPRPCQVPPLPCPDGAPCLELIGARAAPGETVEITARLRAGGTAVAGLQLDLYADRAVPLAMASPGSAPTVACRVDPDIGKEPSVFRCIESHLDGCATVRTLILSLLDVQPIADGARVFSCTLPIPAATAPGRYRLACGNGGGSKPAGQAFPLRCTDAAVVVVADSQGSRPLSGGEGDGGCRVGPAGDPAAQWLLVSPALWLAGRCARRRRRPAR